MEVKQTVRTKDALGVPRLGGRMRRPRVPKRPIEPVLVEPINSEPLQPVLVCPIDDKPIQPILICPIPEDSNANEKILQGFPTESAA